MLDSAHALFTPHFSENEEYDNGDDGEHAACQERCADSEGIDKVPYQRCREDLTKGDARIREADALRMFCRSCTG